MSTPIFDPAELSRVAKLARLHLTDTDHDRLSREMGGILGLISTLQSTNTEGVVPLAHPLSVIDEIALRLREDRAAPANDAQATVTLAANAPQFENGLFLVPRVVE